RSAPHRRNAFLSFTNVLLVELEAHELAPVHERAQRCAPHTHERIKHNVASLCQREYATLDQFDRKLTWVASLFGVIGLDVRNVPNQLVPITLDPRPEVRRVFSERVAA